jgi:hypothetical protein
MDDRHSGHSESESAVAPVKQPIEQVAKRRKALAMHIDQLEEIHRAGTDLEEALAGIELDAWELDQLSSGLSGEPSLWGDLVVESVAFQNKCQTDLGWGPDVQQLSVAELNDFREILITDASLGIALLNETQRAINQLISNGEMDVVKKLTGFRNKLSQCVNELKSTIGEKGFDEATSISEGMVVPEALASWTEREARTAKPRQQQKILKPAGDRVVFKEKKQATPGKSHTKPLMMLLGLAVVVWGVFILPKLNVKTVQTLSLSDVSPRSEIRYVVAKPPSLYVELDTQAWGALSGAERLSLIEDVGKTAAAAGYNGAHFKLENGKTAGQWLKEHGSRLIN